MRMFLPLVVALALGAVCLYVMLISHADAGCCCGQTCQCGESCNCCGRCKIACPALGKPVDDCPRQCCGNCPCGCKE